MDSKDKAKKLIKQTQGTTRRVLSQIDSDEYCPNIIQQIDSIIGTLKSVRQELLAGHLDHCLEHRLKTDKAGTVSELLKIYKLNL